MLGAARADSSELRVNKFGGGVVANLAGARNIKKWLYGRIN
jgi:hypothetical protein